VSAASLPLRIVPSVLFDIHRPQRMMERSLYVYKRGWMVLLSGFVEPLFYLLSIRVGLAALVGDVETGGVLVPCCRSASGSQRSSATSKPGACWFPTTNSWHRA